MKRKYNPWAVKIGSVTVYKDGLPTVQPIYYASQHFGGRDFKGDEVVKVCPNRDTAQRLAEKLAETKPLKAAA